jgi:hypothetical protein
MGQGAASEAINILLSAAERARANRQFAAEVICLQTASQFGDHSSGPPVRELEAIVEGPRVGLAAWFTEALRKRRCRGIVNGIGGFRAHGRPCRGRRCSRARGRGLLPFGIAWIGVLSGRPSV